MYFSWGYLTSENEVSEYVCCKAHLSCSSFRCLNPVSPQLKLVDIVHSSPEVMGGFLINTSSPNVWRSSLSISQYIHSCSSKCSCNSYPDSMGTRCSVVVKATSRKVAGSRPDETNQFSSIYLILPVALEPGVYSADNRNEYRKQMFLGNRERPARRANNLTVICEPTV
jgi:hypothetical protein